MNFYPHFLGDYGRDTGALTLMEHGAYRVLLDHYYATEKPLPTSLDECERIAKAMNTAERRAVSKVLELFFPFGEDGLRHSKRADAEIAKAHGYSAAQSKRANNRWHPSGNAESMPPHMPSHMQADMPERCRSDANHNHSTTTPLPPSGAFAGFWEAWPKSSRKAARGKCSQLWTRGSFDAQADAILAHVEQMKLSIDWRKDGGAFIPAPLVYLNQRRWEGADVGGGPHGGEPALYRREGVM